MGTQESNSGNDTDINGNKRNRRVGNSMWSRMDEHIKSSKADLKEIPKKEE